MVCKCMMHVSWHYPMVSQGSNTESSDVAVYFCHIQVSKAERSVLAASPLPYQGLQRREKWHRHFPGRMCTIYALYKKSGK